MRALLSCGVLGIAIAACGGSGGGGGTPAGSAPASAPATGSPASPAAMTADAAARFPASTAMSRWTPHRKTDAPGELPPCSEAFHDSFAVVGPDGKRYPTWHPPTAIDPATGQRCAFGHEHGEDPSRSTLWPWIREFYAFDADRDGRIDAGELALSGVPFGYVNEQLDTFCTANGIALDVGQRIEDHVGHKVMVANRLQRSQVGGPNAAKVPIDLYCDTFAAFHQGTHSADAFRNSVHEVKMFADCNAGSLAARYPVRMAVNVMGVFGRAGGFLANDRPFPPLARVDVGAPTPSNSPVAASGFGSDEIGLRAIPTLQGTVLPRVLVPEGQFSSYLDEDWNVSIFLRRPDGGLLFYTSLGLEVFDPGRIFDSTVVGGLRRSIDMCYQGVTAAGELTDDPARAGEVVRRFRGGACPEVAPLGPATPRAQRLAWDDPRSPFTGCKRTTYVGAHEIANAGGPAVWYTDPYGRNASTTWFPGSVRQWIARVDVNGASLPNLEAEAVETPASLCTEGMVRAPN